MNTQNPPPASATSASSRRKLIVATIAGAAAVSAIGAFMLLRSGVPSRAAATGTPPPAAHADAPPAQAQTIHIALSAAFVSERGIDVYAAIADYLGDRLGVHCEVVTGLSYGTIDSALESGSVDVAFICGLPYVLLHDREVPVVELLAAPVMKADRYADAPQYFSDLIVNVDSGYTSLEDLRGATYVYNEETSNSGYNMPRYRLLQAGLTDGFFGRVLRSGSHEESIRMVAQGQADASFVDSLVLDYDREVFPEHAARVCVIESMGPAGTCPIVASARVPAELRARIAEALLTMHQSPEGRRILDASLVDRFVAPLDSNWDDVRRMHREALESGFTQIR